VTRLLLRLAGGFALLAAVVWFVGPERIVGALSLDPRLPKPDKLIASPRTAWACASRCFRPRA